MYVRIWHLRAATQWKPDAHPQFFFITIILSSGAITCRVATSFVRVGHIDLFARRVIEQQQQRPDKKFDTTDRGELQKIWGIASNTYCLLCIVISYTILLYLLFQPLLTSAWQELEEIIWHACKREYKTEAYDPYIESKNLKQAATKLLDLAAIRIA